MEAIKLLLSTRKNIIALLIIGILAIGLLAGLWLVQQQTQLKSRATTGNCGDNPETPPVGYDWKADCLGQICTDKSQCPGNDAIQVADGTDTRWCYGFADGAKCMKLVGGNVPSASSGTITNIQPNPAAKSGSSWSTVSISYKGSVPSKLWYRSPSCAPIPNCGGDNEGWIFIQDKSALSGTYTWSPPAEFQQGLSTGLLLTDANNVHLDTKVLGFEAVPAIPTSTPTPGNVGVGKYDKSSCGPLLIDNKRFGESGFTIEVNKPHTAVIQMNNPSGSDVTTWNSRYGLLYTGDGDDKVTVSPKDIPIPGTVLIAEGSHYTFTNITFTPKAIGNLNFFWQMRGPNTPQRFGAQCEDILSITAPGAAGTPAPGGTCPDDATRICARNIDALSTKLTGRQPGRTGGSSGCTSTSFTCALDPESNDAQICYFCPVQLSPTPSPTPEPEKCKGTGLDCSTDDPISTGARDPNKFQCREIGRLDCVKPQRCWACTVRTSPTPAVSPTPALSSLRTACFFMDDKPIIGKSCTDTGAQAYTSDPMVIPLVLTTPGKKTIFARFISTTGAIFDKIRVINFNPNPAISNVVCTQATSGQGTQITLTGAGFGQKGKGKLKVGGEDATITNWNEATNTITASLDKRIEGKKDIELIRDDGKIARSECIVGTTSVVFSARSQCKTSGNFASDNVSVKIFANVPVTVEVEKPDPIIDEKVKLDKDGKPSGFTPKLEKDKKYSLIVKAPGTLARRIDFETKTGTKNLDSATLLIGDIAPGVSPDGKINAFDRAELTRQWSLIRDVLRTGDFNQDGRVNSIDYACMRQNINQSDESFSPPAPSPTPAVGGPSLTSTPTPLPSPSPTPTPTP